MSPSFPIAALYVSPSMWPTVAMAHLHLSTTASHSGASQPSLLFDQGVSLQTLFSVPWVTCPHPLHINLRLESRASQIHLIQGVVHQQKAEALLIHRLQDGLNAEEWGMLYPCKVLNLKINSEILIGCNAQTMYCAHHL